MEKKKPYRPSLGRKIRKLRKSSDPFLTQEKLAKKAGISKRYLGMIEAGARKNIGHAIVEKLADALQVNLSELVGK